MSLPSKVGLPAEVQPELDYSIPSNARSFSVRVQPTNLSSITATGLNCGTNATYLASELAFPQTNILFDIPCGNGSPSTFLDTRMTTLNFKATITITQQGVTGTTTNQNAWQRGGGASWIDMLTLFGGDGAVLEQINEYGMTYDTITQFMMSESVRNAVALPLGLASVSDVYNSGHKWNVLSQAFNANNSVEVHSYSLPVMSALIGSGNDKFLNTGRISRLQAQFTTPSILPITIQNAATGTAIVFQIVLSDFTLGLEFIDIGNEALSMVDSALIDGKSYSHGVTYKTSSTSLPATTGSVSLLSGLRGSSLKSMLTRHQENVLTTAGDVNGKYGSKCPNATSFNYSIGGIKYPQQTINPLAQPALSYTETLKAFGCFNTALYQPSVTPLAYCVLSAGGVAQAYTNTNGSDYNWNTAGSTGLFNNSFIIGQNLERIAKRGIFSGIDCTASPIFVEETIAALSNPHIVYNMGIFDVVYIHDIASGLIQVRM
jgi:hypothetical protein